MRRELLSFAIVALLLGGCGAPSDVGGAGAMAPEELAGRIEAGSAPLVLDVRTAEEFQRGHIPGAVNIPHDELAGRLDELGVETSDEVVVHCQSGRRAALAEETLRSAGYSNVRDLTGHWQAWEAAGRPAEPGGAGSEG